MLTGKKVIRLGELLLEPLYLHVEDLDKFAAFQTDQVVVVRLAEGQLEAGLAAADFDLLSYNFV